MAKTHTKILVPDMACGCVDHRGTGCLHCLEAPAQRFSQLCSATGATHMYDVCPDHVSTFTNIPGIKNAGKALSRDVGLNGCQFCHKPGCTLVCKRCKQARFCDAVCQRDSWPMHKKICFTKPDAAATTPFLNLNPCSFPYGDINTHGYGTRALQTLTGHPKLSIAFAHLGTSQMRFVDPHKEHSFQFGSCYDTVSSLVHRVGGEAVLGWNVLENNCLFELEAHACWRSKDGHIWNVVREPTGLRTRISFLVHEDFEAFKAKTEAGTTITRTRVVWK